MKKQARSDERKEIQKQMMWCGIRGVLFGLTLAMCVLIPIMLLLGFVGGESWSKMLVELLFIPLMALSFIALDVWFYHTDFHYPRRTYESFGLTDPDDLGSIEGTGIGGVSK